MPDIGQVPTVHLPKLRYLGKGYEAKKHVGISCGSRGARKQNKKATTITTTTKKMPRHQKGHELRELENHGSQILHLEIVETALFIYLPRPGSWSDIIR